jgi:AmmeMemoRadiSam system protein A
MTFALPPQDRLVLLQTAREAIGARLGRRPARFPPAPPQLSTPCGAFVTLTIQGELRGCIGHTAACQPLLEAVKDVAVSSAFDDPRFPSLSPEEWPHVRIEISVLSPFECITDIARIIVGVHGIMVKNGRRSGLLLPQVASERGWDRETFLAHSCRKAGLPGDAWRWPDTRIEIFSATVFQEDQEEGQIRGENG